MTITRKLLRSVLVWLGLLLLALTLIDGLSSVNALKAQERETLERFQQRLQDSLNERQAVVLALVTEVAHNPQVQAVFAARERQQLLNLVAASYVNFRDAFGVSQFQFHLPPATSFLRVNQPSQYGDDLSSFCSMVVAANAQQTPIGGLEIGRTGVGLRGVAPIAYQGRAIGSVELGLDVGEKWLVDLKTRIGGDWQIVLNRELAEIARFEGSVTGAVRPSPDLVLQATTLETLFFADPAQYREVLQGKTVVWYHRVAARRYVVMSLPLRDYSDKVVGAVDIIFDRTALAQAPVQRLAFNLVITVITLVVGGWGFARLTSGVLRPVGIMTAAATAVAAGDFARVVPVESQDELGALSRAFNQMTAELRGAFARSAERAQELDRRARYLEATAAVARDAASVLDVEQLLARAVHLISEKFDFYHAGLFLLDPSGEWAILRAASSEGGQQMLARGHRLRAGEQGIVGYVARSGRSQIALDVGADRHFFNNPDLPQTRSEMALPLRVQNEVIGVLDVQSVVAEAFSTEDVEVLQTLADQVAMAIHNARLFRQTQQALESERRAYGEASREAWREFLRTQTTLGFVKDGVALRPVADVWSPEMTRAIHTGQTILEQSKADALPSLAIPIRVRDQTIAVLSADLPDDVPQWAPDQVALLEAISGQLAQALERARLYEETRHTAARERLVGQVSGAIRQELELEAVLKTTVDQIQQALGLEKATIRLVGDLTGLRAGQGAPVAPIPPKAGDKDG